MLAGRHVLLNDRGELLGGDHAVTAEAHERGPDLAMRERDFAVDELEATDVGRVVDLRECGEDRLAFGMRPPAADDRLAGNGFGDGGDGTARGGEHDAVFLDELDPAVRARLRFARRLASG